MNEDQAQDNPITEEDGGKAQDEATGTSQDAANGAEGTQNQGAPDWSKAAEKYRQQRDENKAKVEELQRQLDEIKAKGDIEQVKKDLEDAKKAAQDAAAQADKDRVNVGRLAKEGCIDIDVALSLLDENGDVDALRESKPYLFGAPKGQTGLKPSGKTTDDDAQLDRIFGLKK